MPSAPVPRDPPRAEALVLRGFHQRGREQHEPVELSFRAFAEQTLARTSTWAPPETDKRLALLRRLAGADLYLSLACDLQRPGAWERLLIAYRTRLHALARRKGMRPDEADERVDDLLGSMAMPPPKGGAATRLGLFSGRGSLFAFLATLLWRRHVDTLRATSRRRSVPLEGSPEISDAPGGTADPIGEALGAETANALATALPMALARCTPRERLVLVLKHRDGLAQNEIARLLGIGAPRVSRLVDQATAKLRTALQALLPEVSDAREGPVAPWMEICERVRTVLATQGPGARPSPETGSAGPSTQSHGTNQPAPGTGMRRT